LSSARTSSRRAHPDCVPGLLPASYFEEPSDDLCAGADAGGGFGKARYDPDGRSMDSHARRPLADVAAPHSARERRAGDAGPHSDHAPRPTTAANQGRTGGLIGPARGPRSALPVVKTFGVPSLKLKGLAVGMPPKCESQANHRVIVLASADWYSADMNRSSMVVLIAAGLWPAA